MGCDIHLFAEKRVDGKWHSIDKFTVNRDFDPDYDLEYFDWSDYGETCNNFLLEVLPKMIATGAKDEDVRIVFFFDN